jgi:alpha-mannosidase
MHIAPTLLALAVLGAAVPATAQQSRVYIAPDDHTDYWWSADEATYRQAFLTMLDFYLAQADATQNDPPDYQARWNCDGSFWMWEYEHNKPPADFLRLIGRIRDGHISVPLNALAVCLGGAPTEAVLRGMYYPGQIERAHNLRFRLAYTMENQTQPLGVWSLFAGAGARWSWKGICQCATQVPNAWDRTHDIYWGTGLDGSRVLVKWNSQLLVGNSQHMGGYAEARDPGAIVDYVSTSTAFRARYPYSVIGCFGLGWDDVQTTSLLFPWVAPTRTNANRRVRVSNEEDFFADFEATYGTLLPAETRSYGNEWDLHCSSLAEVTAKVRRAVEKLRTAEALAVVAARHRSALLAGRRTARDRAWMNFGLYWEHDFGMDGFPAGHPQLVGRIAWQRRLAAEIDSYVDSLHADARATLGELIPNGTSPRFYVFNPLGWPRTSFADLEWPVGPLPVHVVDVATGTQVRHQFVQSGVQTLLRILAADVPAAGYRVYEVRFGIGQSFPPAGTAQMVGASANLDNGLLGLEVTPGGTIANLIDHPRGNRSLVRNVNGRRMNDLGWTGGGTATIENVGPVSIAVRAVSASPVPHTTVVTLYHGSDRVDVDNSIDANFQNTLTWGFGCAIDNPDVRHEEVGAILTAKLEPLGHYSARAARYDWLTLNHFVDIGTAGAGITLSNRDCNFFKLGNSSVSTLDTVTPLVSVLAGGTGLGSSGGIRQQGGDSQFTQRFALRPHGGYDPAAAMRTALEHQNPLVAGVVTGLRPTLPDTTRGVITVSDPDVLLWALKPHEDGLRNGIVARVWNVANQPRSVSLGLPNETIRAARRITHIETDEAALPLNGGTVVLALQPQQIATVLLDNTIPAQASSFGNACAGAAGLPTLAPVAGAQPVLGTAFPVELVNIPAGGVPVLMFGDSNASSNGVPLPIDLGAFGAPGCFAHTSWEFAFLGIAANGRVTWTFPVPARYEWQGRRSYIQALILTPAGPTAGISSNALDLRLGY